MRRTADVESAPCPRSPGVATAEPIVRAPVTTRRPAHAPPMSSSTSPSTTAATERAPRGRLLLAFLAVYVLWGSTYVAIRHAVETLPPFLMAGTRFVAAGAVVLAWCRWRGEGGATARHWRNAAITGAFLMMVSNGLVCWAEQRVDSSLAALLVATVPLWMLLLDWLRPGGTRPSALTALGVAVGIGGVVLLVWPSGGRLSVDPLGAAGLLGATLSWSVGSLFSRSAEWPRSMMLATGMQMLCGGALQLVVALVRGEFAAFDASRVTFVSVASLVYLMVAGSLMGFTAYVYLLRHTTPARAATYAFVNPIVAMALGAWLDGDPLTPRRLAGAAVIVLGVVLVIAFRRVTAGARRAASATRPGSRA